MNACRHYQLLENRKMRSRPRWWSTCSSLKWRRARLGRAKSTPEKPSIMGIQTRLCSITWSWTSTDTRQRTIRTSIISLPWLRRPQQPNTNRSSSTWTAANFMPTLKVGSCTKTLIHTGRLRVIKINTINRRISERRNLQSQRTILMLSLNCPFILLGL